MTAWFRFWSRAYALHLEDEIAYLRRQVAHERERAEQAIDELIHVRTGQPGVSSTVSRVAASAAPDAPLDPESIVRTLLANAEFRDVGSAE